LESLPRAGGDDWAVVVVARAVLPCLSEVQVREAEVSRRMVILLLPGIGGTIEATSGILCVAGATTARWKFYGYFV
jgi:hypothetical protein